MILSEVFEKNPDGYTTDGEDNSSPDMESLRKSKLTLKQLHRLRIMNDIRTKEKEERMLQIHSQYAPAGGAEAGGGLGGLI